MAPEGPRFGWSTRAEGVLLVVLIIIFAVTGFIPAWRHLNSDFPNYYLIARLYRAKYPMERAYEWIWLQREKDHRGIDQPLVSFTPSTLPSALMVLPWSSLSPLNAKRWWLLVNLAFLALTAIVLGALTTLKARRNLLLMFLAVIPLRDSFLYGQLHILVLLLLAFATLLYFKDFFFLSGMILAAAATLKIYPALFLILFIFKRQWRALVGLMVGLSSAAMISIYLFGRDACLFYIQEILPRALRGETIDPYSVGWNSLSALLRRLFIAEPELNPSPVVHSPVLYAFLHPLIHGFILVAFLWAIGSKLHESGREKMEWASFLFLLLLLSSQPGPYHFVALILTAALVVDYLLAHQQRIKAVAVVAMYALVCGPLLRLPGIHERGWSNLLFFSRFAWMLLLAGLLLWILIELSPESLSSRFNVGTALIAASVLAALVVASFISNVRHLKGQFDNYQSRMVTVADSALATDPVVTTNGLLFTALVPKWPSSVPNTYSVYALREGSVTTLTAGRDWFHPTVGADNTHAWAELATSSGSRVMGFAPASPPNSTDGAMAEAEDAEQPVASPDGRLLAFIREVKGRNSLWIRQISTPVAGTIGERQIADSLYDVREAAFFPDHRIAFSSRRDGRFRLYEVDPVSEAVKEMSVPTCSARYPAISPDGEWLAFSCGQRGAWQIHVMNLHTREQVQLTKADCNSVTPVWTLDSKNLIYATDCGRGLGLTALAGLTVVQ
jgi:glycosyl transferase family 87/WD40 repeat protein